MPEKRILDRPWVTNSALVLLGALLLGFCHQGVLEIHHFVIGFGWVAMNQALLYLVAVWVVLNRPVNRWTFAIILVPALGARLICLFSPPFLSTDIFRYVWDGWVQGAHINPYRYIPADPHLAFLRDLTIYPHINRRTYAHTIYPPGSQMLFLLITRFAGTVLWMKAGMVALEGLTIWVLVKLLAAFDLRREQILVYAWHPLLLWEVASSGHVDGAALPLIALALLFYVRNRPAATGVVPSRRDPDQALPYCAVSRPLPPQPNAAPTQASCPFLKFQLARPTCPVLEFLPAQANRVGGPGLAFETWVYTSTHHRMEDASAYREPRRSRLRLLRQRRPQRARLFTRICQRRRSGNRQPLLSAHPGSQHPLHWQTLPTAAFYCFAALVLLGLALLTFWKSQLSSITAMRYGFAIATALMLLFSSHYPWYYLWLLPFLCLIPYVPMLYFITACFYLYTTQLANPGPAMYYMFQWLYATTALLALWCIAVGRYPISARNA